MHKWLKMPEDGEGNSGLTWDPEEEETPIEVLFKFAESRGADVFASDLLDNVNYAYLLTEVREGVNTRSATKGSEREVVKVKERILLSWCSNGKKRGREM